MIPMRTTDADIDPGNVTGLSLLFQRCWNERKIRLCSMGESLECRGKVPCREGK